MYKDFTDYPKAIVSNRELTTNLLNTGYFVRALKAEVNPERIDYTLLCYGEIFDIFLYAQQLSGRTSPDFYYHNRLETGYLLMMSTVGE